jgi:alpha/beta superfamily hydrolase
MPLAHDNKKAALSGFSFGAYLYDPRGIARI